MSTDTNPPPKWDRVPLRALFTEHRRRNTSGARTGYLSLVAGRGVIPYEAKGDVGNKKPEDLSRSKLVEPGFFVINSMNFGIGSYGRSDYAGVTSPVYIILEPCSGVEPRFLDYVFQDSALQEEAQSHGHGILEHRRSMSWSTLKTLRIPLPPLPAQRRVADYLDRETHAIEALVADASETVRLLRERFDAEIGARLSGQPRTTPNAEKPSSLGGMANPIPGRHPDVPSHWTWTTLGRLVSFGNGRDHEDAETETAAVPVYGSGGPFSWTTEWLHEGPSVLFGRKGTIDKPLYVEGKFWTVDTMYFTIPKTDEIDLRFLHYWARRFPFDYYSTSTALPSMTQTDLGSEPIALPPLEEQKEIANDLERLGEDLDSAISMLEQTVALAEERKAALISAAVTGQIEIPDVERSDQPAPEQGLTPVKEEAAHVTA